MRSQGCTSPYHCLNRWRLTQWLKTARVTYTLGVGCPHVGQQEALGSPMSLLFWLLEAASSLARGPTLLELHFHPHVSSDSVTPLLPS